MAWSKVGTLDAASTSTDDATTTYAIVGVDSREASAQDDPDRAARVFPDAEAVPGERADAIVLVRIDDDGAARTMAISRDLLAITDTGRSGRLATTWLDSPQAMLNALCRVGPGIPVDHVIAVDYRALIALVDAAGGMPVDTPTSTRDAKAHLDPTQAGVNVLNGEQALAWVRSRDAQELIDGTWTPIEDQSQRSVRASEPLGAVVDAAWMRAPWFVAALPNVAEATRVSPGVNASDLTALAASVRNAEDIVELPVITIDGPIPSAQLSADGRGQIVAFTNAEQCTKAARQIQR